MQKGMASKCSVAQAEMETTESAELFRKCAKLKSLGPGVETEVLRIVEELGRLALAIAPAGSYVAATLRLRSVIRLCLPEYRERQKQLLSVKVRKLIHQYGESAQHVRDFVRSGGAAVDDGGEPAQLAGFSKL